ncbi:hypothetical protein ACVWWN_006495 [Mycobacterium sp. URHB0021]|jgi:hypothetical protein
MGRTGDLFRYPGIRSDSDIVTLSFPGSPGHGRRPSRHRPAHPVRHLRRSADWASATDTWTVQAEQDGTAKAFRSRFAFFGTGYYSHDEPHAPEFPGIEQFTRLVVIGSGATVASMIPSLADKAAHVVMLQRTPSYMFPIAKVEPIAISLRKALPPTCSLNQVHPHERFIFRRHLLADVPNAAWCLGDGNGSWTAGRTWPRGELRRCWPTWVLAVRSPEGSRPRNRWRSAGWGVVRGRRSTSRRIPTDHAGRARRARTGPSPRRTCRPRGRPRGRHDR